MVIAASSPALVSAEVHEVWVKTGSVEGAGTDARVWITLYGGSGLNEEIEHDKPGEDENELGDLEKYRVESAQDLGIIDEIRLRHDASGERSGWYVEHVKVRRNGDEDWRTFEINRWLAGDEGDGNTFVYARATGAPQTSAPHTSVPQTTVSPTLLVVILLCGIGIVLWAFRRLMVRQNTKTGRPLGKASFLILSLAAVIALAFGGIWIFQTLTGEKPYSGPSTPRAKTEAACLERIREADKDAFESITRRAAEFAVFIESRKSGAKPFAEEIVSYYGKWRALKPLLPFTDDEGHKKYVEEQFGEHIFSDEELGAAVQRAVEGSLKDLDEIENNLAVALREVILGRSLTPDETPGAEEEFRKAIQRIVEASRWDAAKTGGNLVVSELVAIVGTQVLIRIGVSAGILSTGAANSWWSLGGAFVIGIIVDAVWQWFDDPAGDIEREVREALDNLAADASTAITGEMIKVMSERRTFWDKSIPEILP